MEMILMLSIYLTILMLILTHPLSMGLTLLIQTILMSIISAMIKISSWYSFMLFIVMIGGMMVLFIYMTSIASNEKFTFKSVSILILPISLIPMLKLNNFSLSMFSNKLMISNKYFLTQDLFTSFWEIPMISITIFLFIYLLMTMIATVKITKMNNGPLRQMF